jgi:hypothetical protein
MGDCRVTCIIAHRDGWMVADRRTTFAGNLIGPYETEKIIRWPGLLVAVAGNSDIQERVKRALRALGADSAVERVQGVFLEEERQGHAIVLDESGRICELLSNGGVSYLKSDVSYWAIGSGALVVLGYLACCERQYGEVTLEDAQSAIVFAATLVNDVGDGFQVEKL